MFVSYPMNLLLFLVIFDGVSFIWCEVLSFSTRQNGQRHLFDVRSLCGLYAPQTNHEIFNRLISPVGGVKDSWTQCFGSLQVVGSSPGWPTKKLPNNKILDILNWKHLKTIFEDRICFWWGRKIVGKGGNAGFQHFLLLPLCFKKPIM